MKKLTIQYLSLILLELCKYIKISFFLTTGGMLFSLTQVLMPVIGLYKNREFNVVIYIVRTLSRILLWGFNPFILFYHLPTFCGNAYLANKSTYTKVAIPLLCMIMFITHPVGNQAFLYSIYWLIPITIALYKPESIFLQALGSTFTVQAVGSVVWLYTKQMDPAMLNLLIPLILIERVVLASLTTVIFYGVNYLENFHLTKNSVSAIKLSIQNTSN